VSAGSVIASRPVWHATFAAEDHCYPEWSPNGQWLCYERDDANGYTQIWRVPAFGGPEQQLTFGNSDHFSPNYLNSQEICFVLSPNDGYDNIAKVNVSTYQVTVLSTFQTDHDRPNPAWNGTAVVAEALDDAGNTNIVKMSASGSNETWLTSGTSDIMEPDYSQDNQSVFAVRWTGITSQIVHVDALLGGYSSVTDSLAIRDNPDAHLFAGTSYAVYEREAWNPLDLLLDGGRRRHGSGIYLSRFHLPLDGQQGASLGFLALDRAEPNPAKDRVRIRWTLPAEAEVSLRIYNTAGQLVKVLADGLVKPGAYTSIWNGTDARGRRLANGIYFYTLDNGSKRISRKVVLTE
jgi:Tol biopolymer transport system component